MARQGAGQLPARPHHQQDQQREEIQMPASNGRAHSAATTHSALSETPRVALYARVSTEDQAERQTVQAQLDFLRNWASLYDLPIVGEYVDDGVSGTIPLADREHGGRLLAELPETRPTKLVVYRLDRLGRSVRVLLDAHSVLEETGVTIQSATEPFDTSSPIGRFVFQLLGSIAELERSTITERMSMGRDRHARGGRWLGSIPFGYDVDGDSRLIEGTRLVPPLSVTEADLVRDLYRRIADGSTLLAECERLNALGIPSMRRYVGGREAPPSKWRPSRLSDLLRNTVYRGTHTFNSRRGLITRAVPALVDAGLWEQVQGQLLTNRNLAMKNAKRTYLLRGLIQCACGKGFCGNEYRDPRRPGAGPRTYYRCGGQVRGNVPKSGERCHAKLLDGTWLEAEVWADCRRFIENPGEALAEAQRQLRAQQGQAHELDAQRRTLQQQLDATQAERERVLGLYRKKLITSEEAERELARTAAEVSTLRGLLDSLDAQATLADAARLQVTEAAALLARLQETVADIDRTNDRQRKRQVIELLVARIEARTEGSGRHKRATLRVRYRFGDPRAINQRPLHALDNSSNRRRRSAARASRTPGTVGRSGRGRPSPSERRSLSRGSYLPPRRGVSRSTPAASRGSPGRGVRSLPR
jgi:site-specific DNA recombinase